MSLKFPPIAVCALLAACGGGSGGGGGGNISPPPPPPPPPAGLGVVYGADQDTAGQFELYLVDTADPGNSTKLSGALVADGDVANIAVTPDGERVVYRADQDTDGISELYLVELDTPGTSTRLSDSLAAGGTVESFRITQDGSRVVYRADQDVDGTFEVYVVELDDPGVSAKLSDTLVASGDVSGISLPGTDGSSVVYHADQDTDGLNELYLADVTSPGTSVKLSDTMVAGGVVAPFGFAFSPDGTKVAYIADQDTNGVDELYLVDVATPGASQKLSDALTANGTVAWFEFSPDGSHVVYHADQDTDEVFELYLVDVATPGVSLKLNGDLVPGGNTLAVFAFDSDGSRVLYAADQDTDEVFELYLVETATPGTSTRLNEDLAAGGDVGFDFGFSPDGTRVVYVAEQDAAGVPELYLVEAATPGASVKLNAPLVAGGAASAFEVTPDGTEVIYFADQDTDDVFELYLADIAAPGVSTRLNGPVVAGGTGASNFIIVP
jgi:Tol biopolymer transport system component